jgi:uncharacterized coiled-coil protein SlyX
MPRKVVGWKIKFIIMDLPNMSEACEDKKQEKDVTLNAEPATSPVADSAASVEAEAEAPVVDNVDVKPAEPAPEEAAAEPEAIQAEEPAEEEESPKAEKPVEKEIVAEEAQGLESDVVAENPTDEDSDVTSVDNVNYADKSKSELVELLTELLSKPVEGIRDASMAIKNAFYAIRKVEIEKEKEEFLANGNEESAFAVKEDADELKFKDLLNQLKEKRAEFNAALETKREENLARRNKIIEEINAIVADPDNINKQYNHVQQLQQEFKSLSDIPAGNVTENWKEYQLATEKFYDLLKMNKELRDYDFKKNLEAKEHLCDEAKELVEKDDVVSAFKRLQELHNEWREIGPVAKELREELWAKFKESSSAVNKKYQSFFEGRKEKEKENEVAKTDLCEQIEGIDLATLTSYSLWDEATKKIIALQGEWKKLGFASRKINTALFLRFRKSCDAFFAKKAEFFKSMKEQLTANLQKKQELCEKAEALMNSTDWKVTSEALIALQKEWKTIGPVAKKHSDVIWKRFIAACDHFFEEKNKQTSSVRNTERANLKTKKAIVEAIKAILADENEEDGATKVREQMKIWQETGHVPFKEKDKIRAEYKEVLDQAFDKLDMKGARADMQNYEASLNYIDDQDKVYGERERLVRSYEKKRGELLTFENNMGFFNAKSKSGNSMLKEMERRVEKIKEELALLEEKIKMIDSKL